MRTLTSQNNNINKRQSNIELLRIVSMFMIILSHYSVHSNINHELLPVGFNRILLESSTLGGIGVIIFVLITGYFSIYSKNPFKIKKLYLLITETWLYSYAILLIFLLFSKQELSIQSIIKNMFPISFATNWFVSCYIIFYIFIPYINILLLNCDRKKHLYLIIISVFIFSILNTITTCEYFANALIQFIMFYTIGAYLRKYNDNIFSNKKINRLIFVITLMAMLGSVIIFDLIGIKYHTIGDKSCYFFARSKITSLLLAVTLFNFFNNIKIKGSKMINIISSTILGIYLIHDNCLIREILWTSILRVQNYVMSKYLFIHMILSVTLIFVICCSIDLIRKNTFERFFIWIYNKTSKQIKERFAKIKKGVYLRIIKDSYRKD